MSVEQEAADILAGFVPIDIVVPEPFAEFVAERIAARPSPAPQVDPLGEVNRKLDEILSLLRGDTPE